MGELARGHEVGEHLFVSADTPIHRLPAQVKILSAVATVLVVVATPAWMGRAFPAYAVGAVALVAVARIPPATVARRMVVEVPFVFFALLLPFTARGPHTDLGPLQVSQPGLESAGALLAKATIGVVISIVLAATTTTADMIDGLHRLRVPGLLVQILASMIRYVHVVGAEAQRMSRARQARGFSARGPRAWPVLARSLGTLFIRSYERGERVHLAMLSRGFTGTMPQMRPPTRVSARDWVAGAVPPAVCSGVLAAGLVVGLSAGAA